MVGWDSFGITWVRVTEGLWVGSGAWTACAVPMPIARVSVVTMVAVMRLMVCPIFAGEWIYDLTPRRKGEGLLRRPMGANEPTTTLVAG